jgi:hypothetical protein
MSNPEKKLSTQAHLPKKRPRSSGASFQILMYLNFSVFVPSKGSILDSGTKADRQHYFTICVYYSSSTFKAKSLTRRISLRTREVTGFGVEGRGI